MASRGGPYGGPYGTPVRGGGGWRGNSRYDLPPPVDMWGNPGYVRTEAGYRSIPGDRMHGANFWSADQAQRRFYHDISRGRGRYDVSTPHSRGYGRKNRSSSKDERRDKEGPKDKGTEKVEKVPLEIESLGARLEKEGKFLFKFPESDEEKRRISGSLTKFFGDVRGELGDKTFMEMFGDEENILEKEKEEIDMGGAGGGEADVVLEKVVAVKPKTSGTAYGDSALDRLRFFDDNGDRSEGRSVVDAEKVDTGYRERRDDPGDVELHSRNGSGGSSQSLGIARDMTRSERGMVNTVIEDIVDGRTEDGGRLWADIRNRVIPAEDLALRDIGQFFRRTYNEGITKRQAEYCYLTLLNKFPKKGNRKEDVDDQSQEDGLDKGIDHLFEEEVLDKLSKLAYDGDAAEARKASLRKSRQEFPDSEDIVPKELLDYKLGSFGSMEDYMDYMKEVTKSMVENAAVVQEKCRANAISDRRRMQDRSPRKGATSGRHVEQPESGDKTGAGKRVDFGTTVDHRGNGTYTLPPSGRMARYSSTPNAPRAGVINNNRDDSSILGDNMGLSAADLSIYEKYNVPQRLWRSARTVETASPLLSSTMAGEQPGSGNMQSLFNMVPTGSHLDMLRQFSGSKSDFLEWKQETQILLKNFPEEWRPIKLKSLLKDGHKKLVGHIFHDDANATDEIWKVLTENFGGSETTADYHMDKLTGWMRDGRKCHDYESLTHLYNFIKTHYYGMARLGAEKIPMAESFAYAIAPLLYGRSQRLVNKLKHKDSFNVNKILDIIAEHAKEVKEEEADREKYEHRSEQYSEEDRKYLRDRYFEEKGYRRYHKDHRYKGDRYNQGYRGRYGSPDKYKEDKERSGDRFYKGVSRYQKDRDSSQERSRYRSQDKFRNESRDSSRQRSDKPPYTGYRSYSGERDERKVDHNRERRERSGSRDSRYTRDRYRKDGEHDQETIVLKVEEQSHEIIREKEQPRYRRTRDQTPRGSRSKSPIRNAGSRSWNSWSCTLCLKDDHKAINCHNYTPEEVYKICNERRLCYVCNLSGHTSAACRAECLLCKSSGCVQETNHNKLLCGKYRKS